MKNRQNWILVSLLASILTFAYLAWHHYSIKLGMGDTALCSISSTYNCEAAATSAYSEIFHIPVAVMGGVFHLVLFSFVLFFKFGWIETSQYLQKTIRGLTLAAVVVSLIMGLISLFVIKVICPFCTLTYLLSVINLILGWNLIHRPQGSFSFSVYVNEYRSYIFAVAMIPFISWAINGMFAENYQLTELRKNIPFWIAGWKNSPEQSFDLNVGLSIKAENPKFQLVEFADFKCPHCKSASNTIKAFLMGKHDISFVYKPYPLDGACNPNVGQKGDGTRCSMAAYALCAEKLQSKGWDVHHWMFDNQEELFHVTDSKVILEKLSQKFSLDAKAVDECANSSEIYELIKTSVEEGARAKVDGTPAIFANGKKLTAGQFMEVLLEAYHQ